MATKLHAITKAFNQASVQCYKHDAKLKDAIAKHMADNREAQAALWKAWQEALLAAVQGDNIPLLQVSEALGNLSDERIKALTNAKGEEGNLRELFTQNSRKVWVVKKKTQLTNEEQINLVGGLTNPFEVEKVKPAAKTPLQQAQSKITAALKIGDQCKDLFEAKDLIALNVILTRLQTALAKAQEMDATIGENLPTVESLPKVSNMPKAKAQTKAAESLPKVSNMPKAKAQSQATAQQG